MEGPFRQSDSGGFHLSPSSRQLLLLCRRASGSASSASSTFVDVRRSGMTVVKEHAVGAFVADGAREPLDVAVSVVSAGNLHDLDASSARNRKWPMRRPRPITRLWAWWRA